MQRPEPGAMRLTHMMRLVWVAAAAVLLLSLGAMPSSPPPPSVPPMRTPSRARTPEPTQPELQSEPDPQPEPEPSPAPPRGDDAGSVRFFCMQTNAARAWCRMLRSAAVFNITVEHPQWGSEYKHAKRIGWVLDAVSQLSGDDVVSFNDGTDVLFVGGGPEETYSRFRDAERAGVGSLMFNAERSCYAQQAFPEPKCGGSCRWALRKARCINRYRSTVWRHGTHNVSKWRYLNAGCFVGRVWAVRRFFHRVATHVYRGGDHHKALLPGVWCDQSMITRTLVSLQDEGVVGLDTGNRVYLPTYHLHPELDLCPSSSLSPCSAAVPGQEPLILHLNGKSDKVAMRSSLGRRVAEVQRRPLSPSAKVVINGKTRALASVCPG
eukprot:TRINITY_DN46844_c0_g1_i1.p1 TRINITY_DN46844_c0_g1~~TRINITY_DN46844_c0_g1_i1.p1  ORF type:complete len:394 (+),score=94.79 TRINITY_DN46844_c0_g1_i1:46-1182(+)